MIYPAGPGLPLLALPAAMPKSTRHELAELREAVFSRDGFACQWPGCATVETGRAYEDGLLQMAHLEHRGMGGSRERNRLDNVITLCKLHHDIFDGRTSDSSVKRELRVMLKAQI